MAPSNFLAADSSLAYYHKLGVSTEVLRKINQELRLPEKGITALARERRKEAVAEALTFEKGESQERRKKTVLYTLGEYTVVVAKPGKEAAPDYKSARHYKTHEKTNNPNDMLPMILKNGKPIEKNLTFGEMFERIESLMRGDLWGLELLGMLLFRGALMLDHHKNAQGMWRYAPAPFSLAQLQERIPKVDGIPTQVLLYFLETLGLNEEVKVYTLGHNDFKHDYGRVNTLLTFSHLIAVFLQRRSIAAFAGAFARPPSGMSPIAKTKKGNLFMYYPLLSPEWSN